MYLLFYIEGSVVFTCLWKYKLITILLFWCPEFDVRLSPGRNNWDEHNNLFYVWVWFINDIYIFIYSNIVKKKGLCVLCVSFRGKMINTISAGGAAVHLSRPRSVLDLLALFMTCKVTKEKHLSPYLYKYIKLKCLFVIPN